MSTNINGYKLDINSQDEFFGFVKDFKSTMDDVRNKYVYDKLLPMYVSDWLVRAAHDAKNDIYKFDNFESVVNSALRGVKRKVYEATKTDLKTEYDASVSFVTFYHNGEYYAILYADLTIFVEAWENMSQVSDFSYWDNSDAPDNMDYEEWEKRGQLWDVLLGNHGYNPASVQGVTYAPYKNMHMKFNVDVKKFIEETGFSSAWYSLKKTNPE